MPPEKPPNPRGLSAVQRAHQRSTEPQPRSQTARAGPRPQSPRTPAPSPSRGQRAHGPPGSARSLSREDPVQPPTEYPRAPTAQRDPSPLPRSPSGAQQGYQTAPASTASDCLRHRLSAPVFSRCSHWPPARGAPPRSVGSRSWRQGSASVRTDKQARPRPPAQTNRPESRFCPSSLTNRVQARILNP